MIISIVLILFVGLIAYLHYLYGLLSGLISVVLALIAVAVAMSKYEPMATAMSGGKYNDQAQGICLIALFALTYLVGRIIFDKLVPGNIRLPHLVDGIGGAVCGLIAGIMGAGIISLALQTMPFGASIAGYARYPLAEDRSTPVPMEDGRQVDRVIQSPMKNDSLDKDEQGMLLPIDDMVVGFTKHLSNGGTLSNDKPFESIHPDLSQELFGQRLGIETGGKHTASNEKGEQVEVVQVNVLPNTIPQTIGEFTQIWTDAPKEKKLTAQPDHRLITVTVTFKNEASDEDHLVRLSLGAVRIVYQAKDGSWKNLFPIGTVQGGKAWRNRVDDFMFIDVSKEDRGANFLFDIDQDVIQVQGGAPAKAAAPGTKAPAATVTIAPGTFIEVKRLAKMSLDDAKVVLGMPPEQPKYYPVRKSQFYKEPPATPEQPAEATPTPTPAPETTTPTPTPTPETTTPAPAPGDRGRGRGRGTPAPTTPTPTTPTPDNAGGGASADSPLVQPAIVPNPVLPVAINVGTADADAEVVTTAAAGHITGKKFDILDVDTTSDAAAVSELPKGGFAISALFVPAGKQLVEVKVEPKPGADAWAWASELGNFTVVDGAGTSVKPSGVCAAVAKAGGPARLLANYKANGEVTSVNKVDGATPSDVRLFFLIADGQKAKELQYQGKTVGAL